MHVRILDNIIPSISRSFHRTCSSISPPGTKAGTRWYRQKACLAWRVAEIIPESLRGFFGYKKR